MILWLLRLCNRLRGDLKRCKKLHQSVNFVGYQNQTMRDFLSKNRRRLRMKIQKDKHFVPHPSIPTIATVTAYGRRKKPGIFFAWLGGLFCSLPASILFWR